MLEAVLVVPALAGVPLVAAPWHPWQFCAYRVWPLLMLAVVAGEVVVPPVEPLVLLAA